MVVVTGLAADSEQPIREALIALQRADFPAAEKALRPEVAAHPANGAALTLLGVALDGQQKFAEALEIHRRASASAPKSPDVWNNYANHLLGTSDPEGARRLYLRVLDLDRSHFNANVQLARMALKARKGAEASGYLKNLPPAQAASPNLAPMRIESLYLAGETAEADSLSERWLAASARDFPGSFSIGLALAHTGKFDRAETFFNQALSLAPSDFNALFNLGAVSWQNGKYDRARELLEAARRQQPQNPDVLYQLGCVEQADQHSESAVALLAQAAHLAPQRPDIQKQLALATADVGALQDSIAAWDRYLKVEPRDEVARRERGLVLFRMGRFEEGVAELRQFVKRHPDDAVGHFELGSAENKDNPSQALVEFDRALALNPTFAAAHSARGSLYYQMGKPEAALADLEAAAKLRPNDAFSLDRLGQTYLELDRTADAVRVLRKAAEAAPDDSKTQLHLAHALADAGETAESKIAMDRFRQLGPATPHAVPGGLVDYLSLSPEQRRADYRARVERVVRENPQDPAAQLTYLRLQAESGDATGAIRTAEQIAALKPPASVLADSGRALMQARLYGPARDLFEKAGSGAAVEMELAIATAHLSGPAEGLRLLDHVPASARGAQFFLARAEMLDASGDMALATASVEEALRAAPDEPAIYRQACVLHLQKGRKEAALRISARAEKTFPQNREMLLLRTVTLERVGQVGQAAEVLARIQGRWPEWPEVWLAQAALDSAHGRAQESQAAMRTARALGSDAKTTPDLIGLLH
jgi:tetratricopeptide (TPR) repeat protein